VSARFLRTRQQFSENSEGLERLNRGLIHLWSDSLMKERLGRPYCTPRRVIGCKFPDLICEL
jgi:hypothetical protein